MAAVSQSLTEDQKKFLEECETEFKDRFTETDEEYMKIHQEELSRPPIVHPWWTPQNNRGGRNSGGRRRDFRRIDNDSGDRRRVKHGHDGERRGYGGEQSGYNDNRGRYNNDSQGYDNRRGYNDDRRGYHDERRGYNDNKRRYDDEDRQRYGNVNHRYEDQRSARD